MNAPLPDPARLFAISARRVAIGASVIDLATHEVSLGEDAPRQRLTPKAIGVLRVLIDNEGRPVHRDALIQKVWPNQFPTDDVVTKAVRELRRALGETEEQPVIATLPRIGYLLKLPVVVLPDLREAITPPTTAVGGAEPAAVEPSPSAADVALPARSGRQRRVLWSAAAALALGGGFFIMRSGDEGAPVVPVTPLTAAVVAPDPTVRSLAPLLEVSPFTADPGDEGAPDVSDDGKLVAYTSRRRETDNYRVYIRSIDGLSERRLTTSSADEDELQPVFAPDGHQVAFQRLSSSGDCSLHLIDLNGGEPRQLTDCASGFLIPIEFSRDGKFLLLPRIGRFRAAAMGFQQLDLASGEISDFAYPSDPRQADVEARFSPDGKQMVIRRGAVPNSQLLLHKVGSQHLPQTVTGVGGLIRGMTWLADNRNVVFATDASGTMELWRLDSRTLHTERFGGVRGYFPAAASNASILVTQQIVRPSALLAVELDGKTDATWSALFVSTRAESWPAYAPDGRTLAFVSDRGGSAQIYLGQLATGEVSQLSQFTEGNPLALNFSPDGRSLAFSMRTLAGPAVGVVELGSRRTRLLRTGLKDPGRLQFAADGSLLLDAELDQRRVLFRLPTIDAAASVINSSCQGRLAKEVQSGRLYFLGANYEGMYVQEPGARDCRQLTQSIRWINMDSWIVQEAGPVAALMNGENAGLFRIDPQSGEASLLEPLKLEWASSAGIAVSPDGKHAVVSAPIDEQGDLLLVRGF